MQHFSNSPLACNSFVCSHASPNHYLQDCSGRSIQYFSATLRKSLRNFCGICDPLSRFVTSFRCVNLAARVEWDWSAWGLHFHSILTFSSIWSDNITLYPFLSGDPYYRSSQIQQLSGEELRWIPSTFLNDYCTCPPRSEGHPAGVCFTCWITCIFSVSRFYFQSCETDGLLFNECFRRPTKPQAFFSVCSLYIHTKARLRVP